VDVFQQAAVPGRTQPGEALGTRVVPGSRDQPEVTSAAAIGTDVEAVAAPPVPVIHGVFVVLFARREHLPDRRGIVGGNKAPLAAGEGACGQEEVCPAPRALDADPEESVRLLVAEILARHPGAV